MVCGQLGPSLDAQKSRENVHPLSIGFVSESHQIEPGDLQRNLREDRQDLHSRAKRQCPGVKFNTSSEASPTDHLTWGASLSDQVTERERGGTHQEQTSANNTANGDHGDVTVLELPFELALTVGYRSSLDVGILIVALLGVRVELLARFSIGVGGHRRRRYDGRRGRRDGVCRRF